MDCVPSLWRCHWRQAENTRQWELCGKETRRQAWGKRTRTSLLVHPSDIGDFRSSLVVNGTVSNNRRSCVVGVVVRVRLVSRRRSPHKGPILLSASLTFLSREMILQSSYLSRKTPLFHKRGDSMPLPVRLRVTCHILFRLDV